MKTASYKITLRIILSLIATSAITVFCLHLLYVYDNKYTKKADVTQENISLVPGDGIRFLVDSWEFYPDLLLAPQDFEDLKLQKEYYRVNLGDYPNLALFHENRNPYGTATYRIRLKGDGDFSIYLPEPLCAMKVFINGKPAGENGSVSPESYQPLIRDIVCQFRLDGETDLIIQTANYSHYYGGIYYPPALGDADSISHLIAARMVFYGLLCFSSFALALFCSALWIGRNGHRDSVSLYFGLLSLSFAVRISYPFLRLMGIPLIRPLYALEDGAALLSIYCSVRILLLLFASSAFIRPRLITWTAAFSMGMCAVGILMPLFILPYFPELTVPYGILNSWYKVGASVFLTLLAVYGAVRKLPHALFSLLGITVYGICLFSNVFFINEYEPIRTGWQDEYGSFVLVIVFSVIMVQRNHAMVADNLRLTNHLQEEVADKTQHLALLLKERSQFMAELGHDMKSPLTSLSNMVQIIRRNNILLDDDTQEKIRIMDDKCKDLANRVHSIQDIVSEVGNLDEMGKISLNQFLLEFYRDYKPVIELSGPDFSLYMTHIPCPVLANRQRLQRALENLIFNAADFTSSEGYIKLTLECKDGFACIDVSDNGCGITPTDLTKIFNRYYTTRLDQGGQGLGLAITKSIVTEHGGELTVSSEVGEGTIFTIRLPLL